MRKDVLAKAGYVCAALTLCVALSITTFAQSDVGTITGDRKSVV